MFKYCSAVLLLFQAGDARYGSTPGTSSGRSVAAKPVSAESPVVTSVNGAPLRAWNTVPSCQSRVNRLTKPWPAPRLITTADMLKIFGRSEMHGPSFVEGSVGFGKMFTMSVPGSPWLMHLLRV